MDFFNKYCISNKIIFTHIQFLVIFIFFLSACQEKVLDYTSISSDTSITGKLSGFTATSAESCTSPQAVLYKIDSSGEKVEPALAQTTVDSFSGAYKFNIKTLGTFFKNKSPIEPLVVFVTGCGNTPNSRLITSTIDQDVTSGSSLIGYLLNSNQKDKLATALTSSSKNVSALIAALSSANSLSDAYEMLNADAIASALFTSVFGVPPTTLMSSAPQVVANTLPKQVQENVATVITLVTSHFSGNYSPIYVWKLDDTTVGTSTASTFSWTPGANDQGNHVLSVTIGSNNGSGGIDTTKPVKVVSQNVLVSNDVLPTALAFSISFPTISGATPINTRFLTLALDTGTSKVNCASFSALALTENSSAVPEASTFNISCSTAVSQSLNYTLVSIGDGAKVLRLWARDAAGVVSSYPTVVSVNLDVASPVVSISTNPSAMTNSTSQSFTFSGNDNGGTIDHFECKMDAGAFAACSSPFSVSSLAEGDHNFSLKAIDTAGNVSNVDSKTWHVDLTIPVLSITGNPALITNSLSATFGLTATDSGGSGFASYQCNLDSAGWTPCAASETYILASGTHQFQARALDVAGNISSVQSYSWTIDTVGPTVTISSKPALLTNSTSASFSFSGTDTGGGSVASYECQLDGGGYSACTSGRSYTILSAAAHIFNVRAIDSVSNTGVATTYSWTIDTTTPMASINEYPASITNATTATFTFNATPPPAGSIIGYECNLNSAGWNACNGGTKSYSGLSQGSQTFQVRSIDNNSNVSSPGSYTWTVDTTLPTVTIATQPTVLNNSTSGTFTFTSADSGGGAIAGMECKLDSGAYVACSSPQSYSSLGQGSHTFYLRATDTAGNVSSVSSFTWTTDLAAPVLSITGSPSAFTNSSSASFTFSATDSGGGAVVSYSCSFNGGVFSDCMSVKTFTGLTQGNYSLAIIATDTAGNNSSATTVSWTVDTTVPTVTLSGTPNANANSASATFTFSATDSGGGSIASIECSINSGAFAACVSPKTYTGLAEGTRTFDIRAIDTAGNTSGVTNYTWTIDTTAPTTTITTPATNLTVVPVASLSVYTIGGACETGLTVNITGAVVTTATCSASAWSKVIDISAVADGTLTISAAQTDVAGNTMTANRTVIKDITGPVITLATVPSTAQKGGAITNIGFTVTEANITTLQNFTASYSTDNGSTWTNAGTVASLAGPLNSASFTYAWTMPTVDSSQVKVRVSGIDTAGNTSTSTASNAFTIDSTAPILNSIQINGGISVSLSSTLSVLVNATDTLSGISSIRFADASGTNCQAAYADNNWQSFTNNGGAQSYSYITGFANGLKKVCAWAKDITGNVSQISTNSDAGTNGVDTSSITLDQGSPPTFTSLAVTNGNSGSANFGTTTIASGDAVNISFTLTDDSALATNPVSIYKTTDNVNYTLIASNIAVGTPGAAQTSWSKVYNSFTATESTYFKLRLIALDANGNTSQITSAAINVGKWSLFAGNEDVGNGSSALSSVLRMNSIDNTKNRVAINSKNEIFVVTIDQIRKIDPTTGNINSFLQYGTATGVPGTIDSATRLSAVYNIEMDGDTLYIASGDKIYSVNTLTNYISVYAGGGTLVNTTNPSQLYVWALGALTMDRQTKDLYFVNTCDSTVTSSSNTVSIKVQKITQDPNTKLASSVVDVAGNCVKGNTIDGADALSSPLENLLIRSAHGALAFVPSVQALYFIPYGQLPIKIINGKLYRAKSSLLVSSMRGNIYIQSQNKIFQSKSGSGIVYFTPNANLDFDEVATAYIGDESDCVSPTCRDDGVDLSSAGVFAGSIFSIAGQLGVVDNATNTLSVTRLRVVDTSTNTLQTLAGTDRFNGDGKDRLLARFGGIQRLLYKSTTTSGFPLGLYAMDGGGLRMLQMDPAQQTVNIIAGSGVSKGTTAGETFGPNLSLGSSSATSTLLSNFALNPLGLFTYYAGQKIYNVKSDLTVEAFLNSGTTILAKADGFTGNGALFASGEHKSGMVYDNSGNLYFGGYNTLVSTSAAAQQSKIMVRRSSGTFYTVIGNSTLASSADCSTAGCAQSKSITGVASSDQAGATMIGPFDNRYNSNEGRLLFAEGTKIRFVSSPYDPSQSKLGTLTTQSGTSINFGRSIGAFTYTYVNGSSEQIDKVYYLASDENLYCYKVSTGSDSNCNNTSIGLPSSLGITLSESTIAMGDDGAIYVVNKSQNAIYKYSP